MMQIRPATVDDAGVILKFIKELAEYEEALHCVESTEQDIVTSLLAHSRPPTRLSAKLTGIR